MWKLDCEEGWAPKNWCFWTVVLEKTLESPMDCKGSNQSILKEISPGISLEGMMLKLKLQYFGHLMRRADYWKRPWCWEGLRAGGEGDDRGWDGWMVSPTLWTWVWVNSRSWWWTGRTGVLWFMGSQRVGHDWASELNWSTIIHIYIIDVIAHKTCPFLLSLKTADRLLTVMYSLGFPLLNQSRKIVKNLTWKDFLFPLK